MGVIHILQKILEFLLFAFPVLVLYARLVTFDSLNSLDTFLGSQEVSCGRRIRK